MFVKTNECAWFAGSNNPAEDFIDLTETVSEKEISFTSPKRKQLESPKTQQLQNSYQLESPSTFRQKFMMLLPCFRLLVNNLHVINSKHSDAQFPVRSEGSASPTENTPDEPNVNHVHLQHSEDVEAASASFSHNKETSEESNFFTFSSQVYVLPTPSLIDST